MNSVLFCMFLKRILRVIDLIAFFNTFPYIIIQTKIAYIVASQASVYHTLDLRTQSRRHPI